MIVRGLKGLVALLVTALEEEGARLKAAHRCRHEWAPAIIVSETILFGDGEAWPVTVENQRRYCPRCGRIE